MLEELDHGNHSGFANPVVDLTPLTFSTLYMYITFTVNTFIMFSINVLVHIFPPIIPTSVSTHFHHLSLQVLVHISTDLNADVIVFSPYH